MILRVFWHYLTRWTRYFSATTPGNISIEEYQIRLDYLHRILKHMMSTVCRGRINGLHFPQDFTKQERVGLPEHWLTICEHIEYVMYKYNRIGRFCVVVHSGAASTNLPFYPGLMLTEDVFWNDIPFTLRSFLHEAYHDFYIGDDDGGWYMPLRRRMDPPFELFATGASDFGQIIDYLNSYSYHGITAWQMIINKSTI